MLPYVTNGDSGDNALTRCFNKKEYMSGLHSSGIVRENYVITTFCENILESWDW
jgi:hypothetical protein